MNHPQATSDAIPAEPAAAPPASRRRRWWLWLLAGLLIFIAALPYLLSVGPLRRGILATALAGQDLSVDVQRASLGWFSPIELEQIHVRKSEAEAAVSLDAIRGDRALWQYLFAPRSLGHFDVIQPQVRLTLSDPDAGLIGLIKKKPGEEDDEPDEPAEPAHDDPPKPVNLQGSLNVQRGRLLVSGGVSGQEWTLGDLSLKVELQRPAGAVGSTLVVAPGAPLDHVELSPGVCNDLLKFVAPHLADVARADGKFSLYVDECTLPLGDPRRLRVRGKLVIHAAEIGPGALIRAIAEALSIEQLAVAPVDTTVEFSVIGEQVMHEALQFRLGKLRILTRGTVGFDQSLDLQIEVPMPAHLLEEGPLRTALADQSLVLPVRGTLKKPEIDAKTLGKSGVDVLKSTLQAFFPKADETAGQDDAVGNAAATGEGPAVDDAAVERRLVEQGIEVGEELLEALRKHRAERQAEREATGVPTLREQIRTRRQTQAEADEPPAASGDESPAAKDPPRTPRPRLRDRFRRPARPASESEKTGEAASP